MALTATLTSNFVEGADRVRRFQLVGDTSYPTGGYDVFAALTSVATNPGATQALPAIKRINSVRHRTFASAQVGVAVVADTYTGGIISGLRLSIMSNAGSTELAAGTSTANLNIELVIEGY